MSFADCIFVVVIISFLGYKQAISQRFWRTLGEYCQNNYIYKSAGGLWESGFLESFLAGLVALD